jgi:hypothetical protein
MSRRSRQQSVPDWPKSLALPVKALDEVGSAPTLEAVRAAMPSSAPSGVAVALPRAQERIILPDNDFDVVAAAVDSPPAPTPALGALSRRGADAHPSAVLVAFFFGLTRKGQHLAAELQVDGTRVVGLTPLCLSPHADVGGRIWEALAFYRLCHGREYTATEKDANARQGGKVTLEDVAEGQAVALVQRSGKTVALAMEIEGTKVTEPKVLGTGSRLYAWQEAHAYAQRWFLPKRRKG